MQNKEKESLTIEYFKIEGKTLTFIVDPELKIYETDNLVIKERRTKEIWKQAIKIKQVDQLFRVTVDLGEFIKKYCNQISRWDFFLEVERVGVIKLKRIGYYKESYLPVHQRYFDSIETSSIYVFTPYLTVKNGMSLVVQPILSLYNEKLKSNINLLDLNFKKGIISGLIDLELIECSNYNINSILMKYRSKVDNLEFRFPIKERKINNSKSEASFNIDLTDLKLENYYWDFYLVVLIDKKEFLVQLKNPTDEVRDNVFYHLSKYKNDDNYLIYPYITITNALALTYRKRENYENRLVKLKEKFARLLYRFLKEKLKKKQIWLVFEKFSQTAQDNGYYFFKYVYHNQPHENVYYVIDKKSPDLGNLKGMEDRLIYYMSIKHLLFLYASKLFVSSEAKGHSYLLREQNGELREIVDGKKTVFLQHGVTALKKVGPTYSKKSKNAADLFVVSSEFESKIIEDNFGYNKREIINTGFSRWDALEDLSKNKKTKEILLMPTWRSWLDDVPPEKFVKSAYYNNYSALMNSKQLQMILEEENVLLNFYIHPKFQGYVRKFHTNNKNIKVYKFGERKVNELLMNCSLLITDYSSVAWDQYYQKKPVIFYQFDYEDYEQIQGSYLNMETDLFGDRVTDSDELIRLIGEYIERNFTEKQKYADMRDDLFKYVDKNNSERIYDAIINNNKQLGLR